MWSKDFFYSSISLCSVFEKKTHTIMGPNPTTAVSPDDVDAGVIPRALTAIFANLEEKKQQQAKSGHELEYQVSVQFLELYGEEIRDLLATSHRNSDKLTIRDALGTDEPEVVGATQSSVSSAAQALQHLSHGMLRRVTGATAMNESSSRSHAIFAVVIEQVILFHSQECGDRSVEDDEDQMQVLRSKFNFVDLAGAERQKRTGASGKRLKEGIDINKGLSNLGNVISALGDPRKRGRTHVPYRDAKLTRLLKGSLGGNHKTLMIACVSPAAVNMGESLNCLRYANRAKNIQNKAVVNVDANTRLVQDLQGQVATLASNLLKAIDGNISDMQFSRENLVALSMGGALGPSSKAMSLPPKRVRSVANGNVTARLKETEQELLSTQALLQQSQKYHDDAELELFTVRAQNNVFHAQISALTDNSCNNESLAPEAIKQAFIEKAVDYEKEISRLQEQLRSAEASSMQHRYFSEDPFVDDGSIEDVESLVLQEECALEVSRDQLLLLRSTVSPSAEVKISNVSSPPSSEEEVEADDFVRPGSFEQLTPVIQYLAPEDNGVVSSEQPDTPSSDFLDRKVQQVHVDIRELTRSIEAKEKLIVQIKRNKEREMVCIIDRFIHLSFSYLTVYRSCRQIVVGDAKDF
jgi:Kinesin motor domain